MADIEERFAVYVSERGEHHLRVAALLTGDWHAAEDLVQASLVKLFRPGYATGATPQQMLTAIEKADKVTAAGSASGPGWTGTRYTISGRLSSTDTISGTLDVDQQGRARALDLTTRVGTRLGVVQALTFSDFGARVTVTPPPADQTTRTTVSHLPWPWNLPNFLF